MDQEEVPSWSGKFLHIESADVMVMAVHIADTEFHQAPLGWRPTGEFVTSDGGLIGAPGEVEIHIYERARVALGLAI